MKLKISFESEKEEAVTKLEESLKTHYQQSLSLQVDNLTKEFNKAKGKDSMKTHRFEPFAISDLEVNGLKEQLSERLAEIKDLHKKLDEIKNDYVELSRQQTNFQSENLSTSNSELQAKLEKTERALKNVELENSALLKRVHAVDQAQGKNELEYVNENS